MKIQTYKYKLLVKIIRAKQINSSYLVQYTEPICNQQNKTVKIIKSNASMSWSYTGVSSNNLSHALSGNRKIGYHVAVWNCRKGLLNPDGSPSAKVTDIKLYL